MNWWWILISTPAALGLLTKIAAVSGLWAQPVAVIYLRGDVGSLALLVGVLLSVLSGTGLLLDIRATARCACTIAEVREQTAEERRRFLMRLDHELKNPLTAIRAGLANLGAGMPENASRHVLAGLDAQAQRLSRLATDLRKLAELETRPLERMLVDVGQLLQDVVEVAQEHSEAGERALSLTIPQAPWPLPRVEGDPDLLFLAVYNLLSNALKFTRSGDTIEVRAFEDGRMVAVEVADTGPGIAADDVPHVWEELYRGRGARGIPGSGLGLALVHAVVQRHGGRVELRSREGKGTVFSVRLPIR
jgi:two-component system OmpR family sensor kinase